MRIDLTIKLRQGRASELAPRLRALKFAMESREPPNGVEIDQSIPGLVLYFNPRRVTDYPSSNPNRIEIAGDGSQVDATSVRRAIERFRSLHIAKFFVWFDPIPEFGNFEALLRSLGLKPFGGTNYPVLVREPAPVELPPTELVIRRLSAPVAGCYGDFDAQSRFCDTFGREGFEHFGAFDGDRLVATARLFAHEGMAYLCDAGTLEDFRGRGGQTALIAARITRAAELNCSLCVVQTLGLLTTSLHNIRRAGFQPSFGRSVYANL